MYYKMMNSKLILTNNSDNSTNAVQLNQNKDKAIISYCRLTKCHEEKDGK